MNHQFIPAKNRSQEKKEYRNRDPQSGEQIKGWNFVFNRYFILFRHFSFPHFQKLTPHNFSLILPSLQIWGSAQILRHDL